MASLNTIAPELRLQIYEEVLRFDGSLERTMHIEKRDRMSTAPSVLADTAILRTSRKMYQEALPVFYKVNTICINHADVCTQDGIINTSLSCDEKLVVKAKWTHHRAADHLCFRRRLPSLLRCLAGDRYPKLKSLFVELCTQNCPGIDFIITHEYLNNAGIKSWYTGVARLEIAVPAKAGSNRIAFSFQIPLASKAWESLADTPRNVLVEGSPNGHLEALGCPGTWEKPLMVCARARAGLPVARGDRKYLRRWSIAITDLQASEISSETYRRMTKHIC
ncbi:hypothetical protein LTR56_002415 [Elasticomyces elasticus]|nr:hypothetical protein LTR56_002415 [Elasticomyces elasticus]KAK4929451.1 hypothetical protein LTR49_004055 [Elasticomyces elasticus]KAK5744258.1 hypothetical protein LTS12_023575 [Elasticomyces elasticus]